MDVIEEVYAPHTKPPVNPEDLAHRELRRDEYWRHIPAFADIDARTFHSHIFQMRHSITSVGN